MAFVLKGEHAVTVSRLTGLPVTAFLPTGDAHGPDTMTQYTGQAEGFETYHSWPRDIVDRRGAVLKNVVRDNGYERKEEDHVWVLPTDSLRLRIG